ncbi:scavenger mRNA decapping enzyme [Suillus fuscotomentosus]|uniref:Scavenger mRNA decapping enzyme n=1 Tax=Suillus fuscotomentosus TaxID=1912939 RepID=A0AAD4EEH8_9AGAM|nr:scavenger mRNA decapping enzyme [Suillus fuscotomentosus]KAG1904657.1 scavenger mRNA decapping enzyme [Suillus fuscotomentosus]
MTGDIASIQVNLKEFVFDRVLDENALAHTLAVLGTLPSPSAPSVPLRAVLRFERTSLSSTVAAQLSSGILESTKKIGSTDIYSWFFAWLHKRDDSPDVKIYVICPATDVHVRKYTKQDVLMVHETPALYQSIVKSYILAFDPARTQWVQDILVGTAEASNILNASSDFLILPDMKWDTTNVSDLYLLAIYTHSDVHCMRDLRKKPHLEMLKNLRRDAWRVVQNKWGIGRGGVRMYIHYQPSYYHFHVHIVHTGHVGLHGMTVGQAHLLDDVIALLELDPDDGSSVLGRMTFTYGLGTEHGLYKAMAAALAEVHDTD